MVKETKRKRKATSKTHSTPHSIKQEDDLPGKEQHSSIDQRRLCFFLVVVLVVLVFAAYSGTWQHQFVSDDNACIVENPSLGKIDSVTGDWKSIPVGLRRRLVPSWTLTFNYWIHGNQVAGYRLGNVLIHVVATLVLFELVRRTLQLQAEKSELQQTVLAVNHSLKAAEENSFIGQVAKHRDLFAFGVAGIFALHPIQTESVTYIIQRIESLMGMFYLAMLYSLLRGAISKYAWPWYLLSVLCCALGMASKEVMITAPLVVMLFDWVFLSKSWKALLVKRWWVYLCYAPSAIWLMMAAKLFSRLAGLRKLLQPKPADTPAEQVAENNGVQQVDIESIASAENVEMLPEWRPNPETLDFFVTQPQVLLQYIRLTFWPDKLLFDPTWPVADSTIEILPSGDIFVRVDCDFSLPPRSQVAFWVARNELFCDSASFFQLYCPVCVF